MVDKLKLEVLLNMVDKLTRPLQAQKSQARELASQIKKTDDRLKELTSTEERLGKLAGSGKLPFSDGTMAAMMRDSQAEAAKLNATLSEQRTRLEALNKAQQRRAAIQASSASIAGTRDKFGRAGAGMAAAGGVALGATAAPVAAFMQAEDAATGLRVAMMKAGGAVPETFGKINELANSLGDKLPGTTADYQNMMTMLVRQGMSAQAILGGLGEATAFLAVQLKMPTDQAAEFASKMQDATRTSEKDMMGLMDVIQKGFYLGVDQNNMLNAFTKLSPALDILKMKGLEGTKALAPLVVMADQMGMAGEASGNALRKAFQMSMDSGKVAAASKEAGIGLNFTDGKGEFGGLNQMFAQLQKLKGLSTEKRLSVIKTIFGDDAETLSVVSMMIDKGVGGYNEVQGKMAAQADLQARVNQQLGTLKNLWDSASGTFTNALAEFGAALAPDLKALVTWIGETAGGLREWSAAHPTLSKWLLRTVAVVGVLLVVMGGIAMAVAAVLTPFAMMSTGMAAFGMVSAIVSGGFALIGTAASASAAFLLANPIVLIIAAIAVAALLIWKYWDPIKAYMLGLWAEVKAAFSGGIGGISALLMNWSPLGLIYSGMAKLLGYFGIEMPGKFTEFGSMIMTGLVNGITNGLTLVKDTITNAGGQVIGWFKDKLGIHSPSAVFAELGGFTMAGLDQGLAAGQAGPLGTIMGFGKQVIAAGAAAVGVMGGGAAIAAGPSAAGGGGGGGGGSYEIHVHAAPGMDEQALAKLVVQKIQEYERSKASQGRARLSDSH